MRTEKVQDGTLRAEDFAAGVLATNAVVRLDDFPVAANDAGSEEIACSAGERASAAVSPSRAPRTPVTA